MSKVRSYSRGIFTNLPRARVISAHYNKLGNLIESQVNYAPVRTYASKAAPVPQTYYDILKLPSSAEKSEIKSSFYKLSLLYHPDRNPNDEAAHVKFLKLTEAYSVLNDEARRRDYDRTLSSKTLSKQHSFSNRFRQRPVAKQTRQYPSQAKFRPGFQFSRNQDAKYDNETHQREHYPERPTLNNTPFRFESRPFYNDKPKVEGGSDVLYRMARAVILIAVPYYAIAFGLAPS